MKTSIVLSSINVPTVINSYIENFKEFNMDKEKVMFILIDDNKTPDLKDFLKTTDLNGCIDIEHWTPKQQEEWLAKYMPVGSQENIEKLLIPQNDMRRRNFGYLRAIQLDSDVTIVIDDDNYPIEGTNWLKCHYNGLTNNIRPIVSSPENKIVNPCNVLMFNHEKIFSRGYPLDEIYKNNEYMRIMGFSSDYVATKKSVLNMGLWTNKPDVDSYTNIVYPDLVSSGLKHETSSFEVAPDTYFPVNTQNTSFLTKKVPIFHNVYQDPTLFHRYDDIWMGLFLQKLANRMGDITTFGSPLVEHRRNTHDYNKDLKVEFVGISLNSKMWDTIMSMDIQSHHYLDGFCEIAEGLPSFNDHKINNYIQNLRDSMFLWVELIEEL